MNRILDYKPHKSCQVCVVIVCTYFLHFYFEASPVLVFDPAHSDLERSVLRLLGLEVLEDNCEGRFEVDDRSLFTFYMFAMFTF